MRFFELDGKRYDVEGCAKCLFADDLGYCSHPARPETYMRLPESGVHELCPLREVEHNLPQPKRESMHAICTKTQRASLIGTFSKGIRRLKPYSIDMPFINSGDKQYWQEFWKRFADYFAVELKDITFPDIAGYYGHARLIAHYDWSPEKVGSPDLIPFAPQVEKA